MLFPSVHRFLQHQDLPGPRLVIEPEGAGFIIGLVVDDVVLGYFQADTIGELLRKADDWLMGQKLAQ